MAEGGLTEEQNREFQDKFRDFDKSSTGFISPVELEYLMKSLGHVPSDEDFADINVGDQERCVGLPDFLLIMAKKEQNVALQDKLLKAFRVFDRDGNGFVSLDELKLQMMTLGPNPYAEKEFEEFVSEYLSANPSCAQDGQIDYTDLVKLMLKK